ncbi:EcsC family protein [Petrocella atlantisensis]|uniref:EcsC family protein n=1 Tax=Petrocella atlantisensis TaxID=2173034 RepID=A0A3P7PDT2_9FIRM|nr:EcsC family protein [Petrocella atlantisensis]VDN47068.1 EcsC family protein [Petrocella atlantisensis]
MSEMTGDKALSILDKTYEIALNGIPTSKSVYVLAEEYKERYKEDLKACQKLRDFQIMKCGTSGFLTGLGGLITLPVALPANITSVLYVQIRMVAAIAKIGGYDVHSDEVQSLVYLCLTGNSMKDVVKTAGIAFSSKFTTAMIKKIPGTVMVKINQKVGFRFITKFGQKGIINLGKAVPIVGGIVGAGFDITSTTIIANNAINLFIKGNIE